MKIDGYYPYNHLQNQQGGYYDQGRTIFSALWISIADTCQGEIEITIAASNAN